MKRARLDQPPPSQSLTEPDTTGLADRQQRAIPLILGAKDILAGCKKVGITRTTWYLWMKDPTFLEKYRQARRQNFDDAMSRLQMIAGVAVETLREVATDKNAPASSRVTASRGILDTIIKVVEVEELGERISTLEKLANVKGDWR